MKKQSLDIILKFASEVIIRPLNVHYSKHCERFFNACDLAQSRYQSEPQAAAAAAAAAADAAAGAAAFGSKPAAGPWK